MSAKIKMINFHSGSIWEFPNISDLKRDREAASLAVLSWDLEEDVPECLGREISRIFSGKIRFPGNGIRERRPLAVIINLSMYG